MVSNESVEKSSSSQKPMRKNFYSEKVVRGRVALIKLITFVKQLLY